MPLLAPVGRRGLGCLALLASALAACAAPPPPPAAPIALEPPVQSPPGELPAEERLAWWQDHLSQYAAEDRLEARLCMGEILLELQRPGEARDAFYLALDDALSVREAARAEYGVGRAYFLEGQAAMGLPHLETARAALEAPAAEEAACLIAAGRGRTATAEPAVAARVKPYLAAAGLLAAAPPPPPVAVVASGGIDVTRAQWGAKPMLGNHDPMTKPYRITIHHTAEPMLSDALSASAAELRQIQKMHFERDWADVGYHFLIDRAGRIMEGRSLQVQGAHAGNSDANRGNLGIALLGNFEAQPERGAAYTKVQEPTPAQLQALDALVDRLMASYTISSKEIWAHDHFRETECPGPKLRSWVNAKRSERRSAAVPVSASAQR